jgi:hypothetical protein
MTTEESEDIKRHVDVLIVGLRSEAQLVAEGVAMTNERLERFEDQTTRELKAVRGEARAFRAETARNFAEFRAETAQNFADVRLQHADVDRRLKAVENRRRVGRG